MKLTGKPASKGLASGPARILKPGCLHEPADSTPADIDPGEEIERLDRSLEQSRTRLDEIIRDLTGKGRKEEADILQFQSMLLTDPEIVKSARAIVREQKTSAETAFREVMTRETSKLKGDSDDSEEDYFALRASDYEDLARRVLGVLRGVEKEATDFAGAPGIVVADDITPTEMVNLLESGGVLGIALKGGGSKSHAMLIAAARGVPAVIALGENADSIGEGDPILLDGESGEIVVNPDAAEKDAFDRAVERQKEADIKILEEKDLPCVTKDGRTIHLEINISHPNEIDSAVLDQVEGIGVWRTEFLFLDRKTEPTEDEQTAIYKGASQRAAGKTVVIRTLDAGGDKPLSFIQQAPEPNPELGIRGVRLGLKHQPVLKRQIRAVLRGNVLGNLAILLPMITCVEEVRAVRDIIAQCEAELHDERAEFKGSVPIGIMVEVPAVALALDRFAPLCDFFSAGTNDLVQYTLAADRRGEDSTGLYSPLHAPVIRLLDWIVKNAGESGKPLTLCGNLAAEPFMTPLILGLGFDRLSMPPSRVREIKSLVRRLKLSACRKLAVKVGRKDERVQIEEEIRRFHEKYASK